MDGSVCWLVRAARRRSRCASARSCRRWPRCRSRRRARTSDARRTEAAEDEARLEDPEVAEVREAAGERLVELEGLHPQLQPAQGGVERDRVVAADAGRRRADA